jgi:outer membrane immunogenic protein
MRPTSPICIGRVVSAAFSPPKEKQMRFNMKTIAAVLLIAGLAASAAPASAEEFDGPYVGVAAGFTRDEVGPALPQDVTISGDRGQDAVYFQGFAGYNLAVAPRVRVGAEAAFGIGADDDFVASANGTSLEIDPEYSFEFTGRVGYLVTDKLLAYARGGYQNARVEFELTEAGAAPVRDKESLDGWLVGGGLDYAIGDHLSTRVEYRYVDLGNDGASYDRHQILAGVAWNF